MKLVFTVKEPSTFFHFLESISKWSIHTDDFIKEYYESKSTPFSSTDKGLLKKYIKIRKKHSWGNLDSDFHISQDFDEVYERMSKRLNKKELLDMKAIIYNFRPKFSAIFEAYKEVLLKRKIALENEVKKHDIQKMLDEIAYFYEATNSPTEIKAHLIVNPSAEHSSGGANIEPAEHISLLPWRIADNQEFHLQSDLAVIVHEALHLVERRANEKKWKKLKQLTKKEGINFEILHEAIADTLVPQGYLAVKYGLMEKIDIMKFNKIISISKYKKKDEAEYFMLSRRKISAMIYPLTEKKFEKKESIFQGSYIKDCIQKYKEMRKNT